MAALCAWVFVLSLSSIKTNHSRYVVAVQEQQKLIALYEQAIAADAAPSEQFMRVLTQQKENLDWYVNATDGNRLRPDMTGTYSRLVWSILFFAFFVAFDLKTLRRGNSPPNQSLQQTVDPAANSAIAESPSASTAAERRRYMARQ